MIFSSPQEPPRSPVRQPVLLGLFSGTAIGLGYLLAGVPNVELMTLVVALAGATLGPWPGFVVGAVAATVYSLGSPLGLPVPLLLGAQVLGLGGAGFWGHWGGNRLLAARFKGRRAAVLWWAGLTGAGATLIYDLLTNLAILGIIDAHPGAVLLGAVPFVLLHVGTNVVIFVTLFPVLVPRLRPLARGGLVGRGGVAPLVVFAVGLACAGGARAQERTAPPERDPGPPPAASAADTTAAAAADSAAGERRLRVPAGQLDPDSGPARAFGWQRPLWTPFARTNLEWLRWNDRRTPLVDGGLGSQALVAGEAGTSWNPVFTRDGIPVGTGHILADDPWLTPTEGLVVAETADGADGWGGTGGAIHLRTADPDPGKAVSGYRGIKGKHETYFRAVHLLTPAAAWRAAFEFEESLDKEAYNFTELADADFLGTSENPFPGHSRIRQSRVRLSRELEGDNRLVVEYGTGRLTKDALPVLGVEHLELWDDNVAASMRAALGDWRLAARLFTRNRDVEWGDRAATGVRGEDTRLLETGREGVAIDLVRSGPAGRPATGIELRMTNWRVDDTLDGGAWLAGFAGDPNGDGQEGRGLAQLVGGGDAFGWRVAAGVDWDSHGGTAPTARAGLDFGGDRPWLAVTADYGGRAPRSDELLTPLKRDVAGRTLVLLPEGGLGREKTVRIGARLGFRLVGFDLALDAGARRLRDGIRWQALPDETDRGRWRNGLEMVSTRVTGSIAREGRFLGWGRIMVEGTWQQVDETAGRAAWLPPGRALRSHLMWENHFFREDGILQLALVSTVRGEMADPWDVTRTARLPSRTLHDLLIGFRLVGVHIGVGIMNLAGERTRMTSGALGTGQEVELRLRWNWVY